MSRYAFQRGYGKHGFSRAGDAAKALIRKPLADRGFAQSRLLTDWEQVVGAQISGLARPLRLSHAAKEGLGGTLTIGVLGVNALQVQHLEPAVIERVNAHYGYRAVARIRISQLGPEAFTKAEPPRPAPQPTAEKAVELKKIVAPVADDDLRSSLERLGRNIAAVPGHKKQTRKRTG